MKPFLRRHTKEQRFWYNVEITKTCWVWVGHLNSLGYGMFRYNYNKIYAHRFSYELHKGKIPNGLVIDHLCRNPSCVNPEHLEAVTQKENIMRGFSFIPFNKSKVICKRGHPFNEYNTLINKNGHRSCKKCHVFLKQKYRKQINRVEIKS